MFKELQEKKSQSGVCSRQFTKQLFLALGKAVTLITFWPIWSHFRKFRSEGRYLTSHGKARVKQRAKFIRKTIVSSRAQIVEICSEATFQPLLQLYLLLPKMMCFNEYHNLLEEDLSGVGVLWDQKESVAYGDGLENKRLESLLGSVLQMEF